jgi:hypothetical protein
LSARLLDHHRFDTGPWRCTTAGGGGVEDVRGVGCITSESASRRCETGPDEADRCETGPDEAGRCEIGPDAAARCETGPDAAARFRCDGVRWEAGPSGVLLDGSVPASRCASRAFNASSRDS